jgi:thymidylate synthase (FAD)
LVADFAVEKSKMDPLNDSKSLVQILEVMGNDLTVVNAARVSFSKESKELTEGDSKLIKYLARNQHISPFFHPQIRMRLKMPIFIAREWFRHTVGFARNEVSRRYVDSEPEVYMPAELRARDPNLKQGSKSESIDCNESVALIMKKAMEVSVSTYNSMLAANVAPEVARTVLPQSMYTEFIETASLYAYARLCKLRLDPHAQLEIRMYADAIDKQMVAHFPVSWAALMT